ncbi:MAG: ATP-binding cassette domain-containing protein [Bacilli bacterium]|nr:ATP-binding cassette domain-containing protein [Bacilli bacterium]
MENESNETFVKLINVNKIYNKNVHAVFDFNLDIKKREFIVFVGPSGCGKSTTLRMIAGLEDISSGELYINGELANDLVSKDRDIAMVFQNYALYPNLTVFDNMAFSLKVRHFPKKEIKERVEEAAKILELEDYLDRKPKALSGGQRQRVALGRAIVRNAQLFLMDEPLSNLDAKLRVQMRSEIIKLHRKLNTTTIYVTHDQTEAMTMADRIVVMKGGYVQQIGTPLEIYRHPANKFVASFIGSPAMNFALANYENGVLNFKDGKTISLPKEISNKYIEYYKEKLARLNEKKSAGSLNEKEVNKLQEEIDLAESVLAGSSHKVTFGIRPESIRLSEKGNQDAFLVNVKLSELLGDQYYVHFDFGEKDTLAKVESEDLIKEGDQLYFEIKKDKCHLFDPITGVTIY